MQPFKEIDEAYLKPDPWSYQSSEEDKKRKDIIIDRICNLDIEFERALDVGCGEAWISKDLPAKEIFGYECSDNAASRFPDNVKRVLKPEGDYDLIVATGVMYYHYDWKTFLSIIRNHASNIFVTSNIKDWQIKELQEFEPNLIHEEEFPYNEHKQHLRIYRFNK